MTRWARRAPGRSSASVASRTAGGTSSGRSRWSRSCSVSTRANGPAGGAKLAGPWSTSTPARAAARGTATSSPAAQRARLRAAVPVSATTRSNGSLQAPGPAATASRLANAVIRRSGRAARSARIELAGVGLAAAGLPRDEEGEVDAEVHSGSQRARGRAPSSPPAARRAARTRATRPRYGESREPPRPPAKRGGADARRRLHRAAPAQRPRQRAQHGGLRAQLRPAASPRAAATASRASSNASSAGSSERQQRRGVGAEQRPPAVALEVEPLVVALGELVVVLHARRRHDAHAPARQPQPQREVEVLAVHEVARVEAAGRVPRLAAHDQRRARGEARPRAARPRRPRRALDAARPAEPEPVRRRRRRC